MQVIRMMIRPNYWDTVETWRTTAIKVKPRRCMDKRKNIDDWLNWGWLTELWLMELCKDCLWLVIDSLFYLYSKDLSNSEDFKNSRNRLIALKVQEIWTGNHACLILVIKKTWKFKFVSTASTSEVFNTSMLRISVRNQCPRIVFHKLCKWNVSNWSSSYLTTRRMPRIPTKSTKWVISPKGIPGQTWHCREAFENIKGDDRVDKR